MKIQLRKVRLPDPAALALQISLGRTLLATSIMAAPVVTGRVMGTDTATAQRVTWLTRMTAVRDGALGAGGMWAARQGGARAVPWLIGGAVSDTVDAVVIAKALRDGRLKGVLPTLIVPLAAGTAAAGVATAARLRRR
jgi:hypothetical protein